MEDPCERRLAESLTLFSCRLSMLVQRLGASQSSRSLESGSLSSDVSGREKERESRLKMLQRMPLSGRSSPNRR